MTAADGSDAAGYGTDRMDGAGYGAMLAELEAILAELEGDDVDVDLLAAAGRPGRRAGGGVPGPHRAGPAGGRAGRRDDPGP